MKRYLEDEAATVLLAQEFRAALPAETAGWVVLLKGALGAGKSTFARALIGAMGHDGSIPSPTYTLVEPYELQAGRVYHIDLYRISGGDELRYLGWTELDDGLRLVEWPDRAPGLAESADLQLVFDYTLPGRTLELQGISERSRCVVDRFDNAAD